MMTWLAKHRKIFLSAGMLVCLTAIIFTANPNFRPTLLHHAMAYTVVPLQRGATAATGWVRGKFTVLLEMNRLQQENMELREQIGRLSQENRRLRLADEENAALSALLNISQRYAPLPTEGAVIVGKDTNDWYSSFTIDKGSNHGLKRNMAVLGDFGLLGRVETVYPGSAYVITLIDHRFAVAVKNVRTEDIGVLKGDVRLMRQGLCRMEYISGAEAQIMPGDEIVTSAHGSMFPPGILVGNVLSVEPNPDGLTMYAVVQPAATINRIETVLVVTGQLDGGGEEPATPGE
jgi:rod shape-determining protein MreC